MNEYGIQRICFGCKKVFTSTDGDYFCSTKCGDEWESWWQQEKEKEFGFKMEYECELVGETKD
jgi:rRNA maturation endonuclease Nob1